MFQEGSQKEIANIDEEIAKFFDRQNVPAETAT